jgi:hypothetical protein
VHLVDDEDLELPLRRGVGDRVPQVADLLDAVVGGAVDLDHVQVAALADGDDRGIRGVEVGLRAAGAVERLGEDARQRGLAGAPGADQQVGVGDAAAGDRVLERAHHMVLADDVIERLRPPFSSEDLIA